MHSENQFLVKWKQFCEAVRPVLVRIKEIYAVVAEKAGVVFRFLGKFKKIFLALPIVTVALILAIVNLLNLPEQVGFVLQGDGSFAFTIVREIAVLLPIVITTVCLLLLFISKRTMTPWMVSLCSLLLPLLLYFTNVFPA